MKRFNYSGYEELVSDIKELELNIPLSKEVNRLTNKVKIGQYELPNSLAVHPMEGCDGDWDGSPSELTLRRYKRFVQGGAGLIWFEAVAVVPEGRTNARQLYLSEGNIDGFKELMQTMLKSAKEAFGENHKPLCIMQLTHSGRFSKPDNTPHPVITHHNNVLNQKLHIDKDYPVMTDEELEQLEEQFVWAAKMAKKAGFHGVDIKACHKYLLSELLSGYNRSGKYGGEFGGRTRFILSVIDRVKKEVGEDFIIGVRLNMYDGIAYPYGWGVDKENYLKCDFTEPMKLVDILYQKGVRLINVTMGTPYYNPHVNKPYDGGPYVPEERQLVGVNRLIEGTAVIQQKYPDMITVGTGYSWLRHLAPYVAAGAIKENKAVVIGFGRQGFAYPDFAKDMIQKGEFNKSKCCVACGKCSELKKDNVTTGCVIRDKYYTQVYKKYKSN